MMIYPDGTSIPQQVASLRKLIAEHAEGSQLAKTAADIGFTFAKQGRWRYAGAAMLLAARAEPLTAHWTSAVCEFALQLTRRTVSPSSLPLPRDRIVGKISFVVCSISPSKLSALRANLDRLMSGEPWELIHIDDARSLAEGYNRGLDRANGEIIVLCHDDIAILCDDFVAKLRSYLSLFEVIGVAGSTKIAGPAWAWAGVPHVWCWVGHPLADGRSMALVGGLHGPCVGGAQTLDGLFLAARRSVFDKLRFDSEAFDGFHFYDLDFTYRASKLGIACGICMDITIFHDSIGKIGPDFLQYAERFCAKFPETRTQQQFGPSMVGVSLTQRGDLAPLHQWLARWVSLNDVQLLSRVIEGAAEEG